MSQVLSQQYDEMASSTVAWAGDTPAHWEIQRLGRLFRESAQRASTATELGYPILRVSIHHGISDREMSEEEMDRKVTRSDDRSLYKVVEHNDLAYNMMRAWQGGFGAAKVNGLISPAYVVCKPRTSLPSSFFELLLRTPTAVTELKRFSRGITDFRLRLYWDDFKKIEVPVPPKEEQEQILAFLDYETAKIDALIEKQRQLIALLGEKRQAVISHAVTKGLNPDAPMRDSGVEWLGEVPEHWEVARVKFVSHRISKGDTPSNFGMDFAVDGPVRFIKIENIGAGELIDEPRTSISYLTHNQIKRSHLQTDDIVFAVAGATTGKCAIIREEHLPANTNQAVAYVRPNGRVFPKFLIVWLQNQQLQEAMWEMTSQSAQPNLSMENLGNLPVVVPPIDEQTRIATHAFAKTKNFDLLEAKANAAVELLQERRTALISAAVTGKIDVRGWKRPCAAPKKETEMEVA